MIIGDHILTQEDRAILGSRSHRLLTDRHISAAQLLLKRQHPQIHGLEPPVLQLTRTFSVHKSEPFIQILNVSGNHWITVSTVECPTGTIRVYDSLNLSLTTSLKRLVADLMMYSGSKITIEHIHIQYQMGSSDCGLFAIATATALTHGLDPNRLQFSQKLMRDHLRESFERQALAIFPLKEIAARSPTVVLREKVRVYCICRLPQNGCKMIQCTNCAEWFHLDCITAPAPAAEHEDMPWKCPTWH